MNPTMTGFQRLSRVALGVACLFAACAHADEAALLASARKVAGDVPPKLLKLLKDEIAKGGEASAVSVCNEKAPVMAKAASEQSGWGIRRVSLRQRNPKAVPDAWERTGLEDFERRVAAGEAPATLEKYGLVEDGGRKEFRYMKALPVQMLCLGCHGPIDKMAADVTEKIKTLYPNDQAIGYDVGQLRGAITIRQTQ